MCSFRGKLKRVSSSSVLDVNILAVEQKKSNPKETTVPVSTPCLFALRRVIFIISKSPNDSIKQMLNLRHQKYSRSRTDS